MNNCDDNFRKVTTLKKSLCDVNDAAFVMDHLIEEISILNLAVFEYFGSDFKFEVDDFIHPMDQERFSEVLLHLNALDKVSKAAFVPPGTLVGRNYFEEEENPFNRGARRLFKQVSKYIRNDFEEWRKDPKNNPTNINVEFKTVQRNVKRLNDVFKNTFKRNQVSMSESGFGSDLKDGNNLKFTFVRNDTGMEMPELRPGISEDTPVITINFSVDLGFKFQSLDRLIADAANPYLHFSFGRMEIPTKGPVGDFINQEVNRMLSQKLNVELRSRDSAIRNFVINDLVKYLNLIWKAYQIYYSIDSFISYYYGPSTNRNMTIMDLQTSKWPQELVNQIERYRKIIQTFPIPSLMHEYAFWMTGNYQMSLNPSVGICKIIPFSLSVNKDGTLDFKTLTDELINITTALCTQEMAEQVMILERLNANEATIKQGFSNRVEAKLTNLYGNSAEPEYSTDFLTSFINLPLFFSDTGNSIAAPQYPHYYSTKTIYSVGDKIDDSILPFLLCGGYVDGNDDNRCSWAHNFFQPIRSYGRKGEMCNRFSVIRSGDGLDYTYSNPVDDFETALYRSETFMTDPKSKVNLVINPGFGRESILNISYKLCDNALEKLTSLFFDLERLIEGTANLRNSDTSEKDQGPRKVRNRNKKNKNKLSKLKLNDDKTQEKA